MSIDLFAGISVRDYASARSWYERLFGAEPAFLPNDIEAVWEVAEHRYVYIIERPDRAGGGLAFVYVEDPEARVASIAERGLEPVEVEDEEGGVRKWTYRDADGNEMAFGGIPSNREGGPSERS